MGQTACMDRSAAMPRAAWVEIRDPAGELLERVPANIDGGLVTAALPVFPERTYGTIQLCTDEDGTIECEPDPPELEELPTSPRALIAALG